jgi:hypothetical protein
MQVYINRPHAKTLYLKHPPVFLLETAVLFALKIYIFNLERLIIPSLVRPRCQQFEN